MWVDRIYFNIRLEDDRLCTLVMIGVRADGTKELVALADGYWESTESWSSVLRDLRGRGMPAPTVPVGDGALGFGSAARDVWPETAPQRDWCQKLANVLNKLPQTATAAGEAGAERRNVRTDEDRRGNGQRRVRVRVRGEVPEGDGLPGGGPGSVADVLHLSIRALYAPTDDEPDRVPFATVRLRQRVTKGAGSRTKGLLMAFKLPQMAQRRWRRLNGAHLLPLVRAGVRFVDGAMQERDPTEMQARKEAA